MKKLVMRDTEMMDPPKDYVAGSMGELMEVVRGYDSSPGAIGYSVYYYAEEMRAAEGLKLLAVDGVEPEPEAIRSGEYRRRTPPRGSYATGFSATTGRSSSPGRGMSPLWTCPQSPGR